MNRTSIFVVVAVAALVAGGLWYMKSQSVPTDDNEPWPPEKIIKLVRDVRQTHQEEKWCEAVKKWEEVLEVAGDDALLSDEARRNRDIAQRRCRPVEPVSELNIEPPLEADRPAKIQEDKVVAFYPEGRQIRAAATLDITGSGTNKFWVVFKGNAYFAYRYQVPTTITVISNDGNAVVFRQEFDQVVQLLAVSREELSLDTLDTEPDPLFVLLDMGLQRTVPAYLILRDIVEAIEAADPALKRTLTKIKDALGGEAGAKVDISSQIERLSGLAFDLTYETGLGVTHIQALNESLVEKEDLDRVARNSSLFLDYFLSEVAALEEDQTKEISTRDVGAMLSTGYDADLIGKMTLKRGDDEKLAGRTVTRLKLVDGESELRGNVDGEERRGNLSLENGYVLYSADDLLVRQADFKLKLNADWFTEKTLLRGTKSANIDIGTQYRARLVKRNSAESP